MCDLGSLTVSGNGAFLQLKVEPRSDRPRATLESSDGARSNAAALTSETTILLVAQKRCVRFVRWITSPPTPRCEVVCAPPSTRRAGSGAKSEHSESLVQRRT